ncbi:MAG: D-2-hydroxyacid dehydrogenase [Chloroflexi bacterium]|nr:D-2-hydroxyacid dehydrogenase [Chloroflexota bacterium]
MPIEILITTPLEDDLIAQLQAVSDDLAITVHPARQPEEIPAEIWEKTEILYTMKTLPEPDLAPNLRWIQFSMAGIDRLKSVAILQNQDIQITTLSGANTSQVAEHVLAMMLALGHRLPDLSAHQRSINWASDRWTRFVPLELRNATVGIVGYGSIGRQVARLLYGFGTTILATKFNLKKLEDTDYTEPGLGDPESKLPLRIYPAKALRSMFKDCDFVIVTAPLTDASRGMIGEAQLAALKPTAFLVDISRGGVVDHQALIPALQEKIFAGAALDVFPEEPLAADSPLWDMPNVIITPHIAGVSVHYNLRAMLLFSTNLQFYLEEKPLLNQVDLKRGY